MHTFFEGIFTTSTITVTSFLLCLFVSLAIGMFLAMAAGLICGMGYLGFALLFSLILGLVMYGLNHFAFPQKHPQKILRITILEDLNYNDVFDDIFTSYTSTYNLVSVKTSNMGSLFKLQYHVTLKDDTTEKAFIDALRCRNGNLEIALYQQEVDSYEL